jgi:hypothetical protein
VRLENRVLWLLLFWPGLCFAQLKVEIPAQVGEHQLAVVSVQSPEGLEIDVEVWRSLDQGVPFRELKTESGREFGFVAPPGEYFVRVYGWKAGSVEKFSGKVVIGGEPIPDPVEPDNGLSGLAKTAYENALKVFSLKRESEAQELAKSYSSVASQAAALPGMTAQQMTEQLREANRAALSDEAKSAWGSWAKVISRELDAITERQKLIEAYRQIAKGLGEVK